MGEPKTELQRIAKDNIRRAEMKTYTLTKSMQWLNSRMEGSRMGRCLSLVHSDAIMEKEFLERTDHARIVNALATKETQLGKEIAGTEREKACELLRRHYLRERDPNLRELMTKLESAYICRDQRQQILHNEYKRLLNKSDEKKNDALLINTLYNEKEQSEREEEEMIQAKALYKEIVRQQQERKIDRIRKEREEEILNDKKIMEIIKNNINEENMRQEKQRLEQKERIRREMNESLKDRQFWRDHRQAVTDQEQKRIQQQVDEAIDWNAIAVAQREEKNRQREKLNTQVAARLMADEAEIRKRSDLVKLLQEQEYLEKNVQDDIAEKEKMERVKSDSKEAFAKQLEARRKAKEEERTQEALFRKQTEDKIRKDDEKEREKKLKLKEKQRLYALELKQQMQENLERRRKDLVDDNQRLQTVRNYEKSWLAEVADERKKLVEEHAPHVLGYLKTGVLKSEDLPAVKEGASKAEELKSLDVDSMTRDRPLKYLKCNPQCFKMRNY